jgi:hypothetical protein
MYTGKGTGDFLDYAIDISAGAIVNVTRNTISGNKGIASVDGSKSAGILVSTFFGAGTSSTITENFINDNDCGIAVGFDAADVSTVVANNNDLSNNTRFAILNTNTANNVAATCNWYGFTGAAVLSEISRNITFEPFLNSGTDNDGATNGFQPAPNTCNACTSPPAAPVVTTGPDVSFCDDAPDLQRQTKVTVPAGMEVVNTFISYTGSGSTSLTANQQLIGNDNTSSDARSFSNGTLRIKPGADVGVYTFEVQLRNTTTGCISAPVTVTLTRHPLPAAPVVTTGPNVTFCDDAPDLQRQTKVTVPAGMEAVHTFISYTGAGSTSLTANQQLIGSDNTNSDARTFADGVLRIKPGADVGVYTFEVQLRNTTTGCISAPVTLALTRLALPAAPVVTTGPDVSFCDDAPDLQRQTKVTVPAGMEVVNTFISYTGSGSTSLTANQQLIGNDNANSDARSFSNGTLRIKPGADVGVYTFEVQLRNTTTGCLSAPVTVTLTRNPLPAAPVVTTGPDVSFCDDAPDLQRQTKVNVPSGMEVVNTFVSYAGPGSTSLTGGQQLIGSDNTNSDARSFSNGTLRIKPGADVGVYTFEVQLRNTTTGCLSAPVTVTLTRNPLPVVAIQQFTGNPFDMLCSGETGVYVANIPNPVPGGNVNRYDWSVTPAAGVTITPGPGGQNGDVSGRRRVSIDFPANTSSADVNYTVNLSLEDANGCVSTTTQTVTVKPVPEADIRKFAQNPFTEVCVGEEARFVTSPDKNGPPAVQQYDWSFSGNPTLADYGQIIAPGNAKNQGATYPAGDVGAQTVDLTITYDNGCTSTAPQHTITVNPLPDAGIMKSAQNPFTPICSRDTGHYVAVLGNPNPGGVVNSYAWTVTPSAGVTITEVGQSADVSGMRKIEVDFPANTGSADVSYVIELTIEDANGCTNVGTQTVVVQPAPQADIRKYRQTPFDEVCVGTEARFVTSPDANGTPAVQQYDWTFSGNPTLADYGQIIAPGNAKNQGATYPAGDAGPQTVDLTITYANGCTSTAPQHTIMVNDTPDVNPTGLAYLCNDSTITIDGMPSGGSTTYTTHSWTQTGGSGTATLNNNNDGTLDLTGGTSGDVELTYTLTDDNGCSATGMITVTIVDCSNLDYQATDPCSCNNDQSANGAQDGTFAETVAVAANPALDGGQTWTVMAIGIPAGAAGAVAPSGIAVTNTLNYNAGTDAYEINFAHADDAGYTITVEGPNTPGSAGNVTQSLTNICQYPVISFNPAIAAAYCQNDPVVNLAVDEDSSFAGTSVFTIDGGATATLDPSTLAPSPPPHIVAVMFTGDSIGNQSSDVNSPAFPGCVTNLSQNFDVNANPATPTAGSQPTNAFCYNDPAVTPNLAGTGVNVNVTLSADEKVVWTLTSAPANSSYTTPMDFTTPTCGDPFENFGELQVSNTSRVIRVSSNAPMNGALEIIGTYEFDAYVVNCVTNCTSAVFTSAASITVDPIPTISGVSQDTVVCDGDDAMFTITGLVPNSTNTIRYTLDGGGTNTSVPGIVADASGEATLTIPAISVADHGATVLINGIRLTAHPMVTVTPPDCALGANVSTTLQVNEAPTIAIVADPAGDLCRFDMVQYDAIAPLGSSETPNVGVYTYQWCAHNGSDGAGTCFNGFSDNTAAEPTRTWSSALTGPKSVVVFVSTQACPNATDTINFMVNPLPDVTLAFDQMAICQDADITASLTDNAGPGTYSITADLTVVDGSGTTTVPVSWSGVTSGAMDTYTEGVDFMVDDAGGTVTLSNIVVTNEATTCESSHPDLSFEVYERPSLSILRQQLDYCSGEELDYNIVNNGSNSLTYDLTWVQLTNANHQADLTDETTPVPLNYTGLGIAAGATTNTLADGTIDPIFNNAVGTFDRGLIGPSLTNIVDDTTGCPAADFLAVVGNQTNSRIYPEPVLDSIPNDTICSGEDAEIDAKLLNLPSILPARAGYPVEVSWTVSTTTNDGGITGASAGGPVVAYDAAGVEAAAADIIQTLTNNGAMLEIATYNVSFG